MSYRLIVTYRERPWWMLWLVEWERCLEIMSPPDATRAQAEAARAGFLALGSTVSARMEVVDG